MASEPTGSTPGPQPHQPDPHPHAPPAEARGAAPEKRGGEQRGEDRRGTDRRAVERRAPPPWWRRPAALVTWGVLGALAVVGLFALVRPAKEEPVLSGELTPAPVPGSKPATPSATPAGAPAEEAFGAAGFERLVIQGDAAAGKRALAELYCEAPTAVAVTPPATGQLDPRVAALADAQRRVPAAECKWGRTGDQRREDFLLLVPAELADEFSELPVINDDFVQRRRLVAEVEWIGRSSSLALRTAGVLRAVRPARG